MNKFPTTQQGTRDCPIITDNCLSRHDREEDTIHAWEYPHRICRIGKYDEFTTIGQSVTRSPDLVTCQDCLDHEYYPIWVLQTISF